MANIEYNEDITYEFFKKASQLKNKTEEVNQRMATNYSAYTSSGLLNEPIKNIDKNFNSLGSVVASVGNAFLKHGAEMVDFDRNVAKEISGMATPKDFDKENSMKLNTYNESILAKLEEGSISKDKATEEQNYDDSSIASAEDLFNMNKEKDTDEKVYDDTTIIGESILGKVNGGETDQREIDESTSISNVNLNGVKDGDTTEKDFDDSTVIGESILGNINSDKEKTEEVDVDDAIAAFDGIDSIELGKEEELL